MLVLWVLTLIVRRGLPSGPQPIRWLVLGYLIIQVVGYAVGHDRGLPSIEANSADRWMISTCAMAGLVLCFADGLRTRPQLHLLLTILLGLASFAAMVGILQFFVGFDLQPHIRIPGLRPITSLFEIGARGTDGSIPRVAGLTSHFIEYGVVLAALTPIAIHFALYARNPLQRFARWGAVAALASAIPLSVSRSGVLALGVGMLTLAVVWSWRLRYSALVISIVSLALFRAVTPGVLGTIRSLFSNLDNDPSVEGRTEDYDIVMPMIYDRLWLGRGAGTFMPERYVLLDNQFLNSLASGGLLGLIGILGLFVGGIGLARSIRRRAAADQDRHLAQALSAALAACLVTSFTFDSLSFAQFSSLLWILLGMVGALWRLAGVSAAHASVTTLEFGGRVMPPLWSDAGWVRR